jgi:hypothetical protein
MTGSHLIKKSQIAIEFAYWFREKVPIFRYSGFMVPIMQDLNKRVLR